MSITRKRLNQDGSIEIYKPYTNADGYYILADTSVRKQHNLKENQIFVKSKEALIARIKQGFACRMEGMDTGQRNLIHPDEIEFS